ncbi:hypothetical protein VNI00_005599 [Paramarasmius palmivorus]|uniref:Uncharacterized protein n=1 Tax=Paramarasmius palmivorus TaxID=297713 RepID=A0AAW0DEL8_9AGAR
MAPSVHSEDEKHVAEYASSPINAPDINAEYGGLEARKALEKKLLRKIDLRMSILIVIYILNYIDRNNAAAAREYGFEMELQLKDQEVRVTM